MESLWIKNKKVKITTVSGKIYNVQIIEEYNTYFEGKGHFYTKEDEESKRDLNNYKPAKIIIYKKQIDSIIVWT